MKTNISIELDDSQRDHLSNIFYNKKSTKLISRKELNDLVQIMIADLLDQDIGNFKEVTDVIAQEGASYKFNSIRVTKEEWDEGIHVWLAKRKQDQ